MVKIVFLLLEVGMLACLRSTYQMNWFWMIYSTIILLLKSTKHEKERGRGGIISHSSKEGNFFLSG